MTTVANEAMSPSIVSTTARTQGPYQTSAMAGIGNESIREILNDSFISAIAYSSAA